MALPLPHLPAIPPGLRFGAIGASFVFTHLIPLTGADIR